MPNGSRMDINQLKNEKIRDSYSDQRAKGIETIEPTKYLKAHANRIGTAIKKGAEVTTRTSKNTNQKASNLRINTEGIRRKTITEAS